MPYLSQHSHALVVMSTSNPSDVETVWARMQGEKRWLEAPFAFEVLDHDVDELTRLSLEFDRQLLDFAIVPLKGREKKFVISDMDSTLIGQECIDEIAARLNLREQVSEITERAMRGELDFEYALKERVALLKGIPETALQEIWSNNISLMPGGKLAVQTMAKHGSHSLIVSGGFTYFSEKVASALGFEGHQANTLNIENGKLTGNVGEPILGQDAKLSALLAACERYGFTPSDTLAIGDGANDLKMIEASGMGIAFNAKPAVQAASKYALNYTDLRGILYLQGYDKSRFAQI